MEGLQNFLVFLLAGMAVYLLLRRFVFKKKQKGDCDTDCGCH
jgi:multisubunit Na+/H+ antiporter MnhC subunit